MRRILLTLPTNRACPATIAAVGEEAAYAAEHFDVEVCLLILDSCDSATFEEHAEAVGRLPGDPRIVPYHLGEAEQAEFLRRVIGGSGSTKPDLLLDLMLPARLSYGACTNRAFLIGAALGCESVHRRDSDSRYQVAHGETVFPIRHELMSLGKPAVDAEQVVDETALPAEHMAKPVAMVGSSFVGEMSVDIGEILEADHDVYHDVVSMWAPAHWTDEQRGQLVDESFRGAGSDAFVEDHSTLTLVDPMRVDMCNISFHGVHERVPLPPATDTIGSDYFLIHLVHDAAMPGVVHNRNIENFYTGERRTDPGFLAYQTRFTKFLLSMLYFNFVYDRMAQASEQLVDAQGRVRASVVADIVHDSAHLDRAPNIRVLERLAAAYRGLGGRYTEFVDSLTPHHERLLDEARRDMEDFAVLTETWRSLVRAARNTPVHPSRGWLE